jgi:excisionase family DNA binding protein
LLTVDEVAAVLRCSRHSVYRAVARGELRALRVGERGPLRVRRRDVEQFLQPAGPEAS